VVAARLSEIPDVSILLIEAGYEETDYKYTKWAPMENYLELTGFDWQFATVPQDKCCDSLNNKVRILILVLICAVSYLISTCACIAQLQSAACMCVCSIKVLK
jgi:hypothetical protein